MSQGPIETGYVEIEPVISKTFSARVKEAIRKAFSGVEKAVDKSLDGVDETVQESIVDPVEKAAKKVAVASKAAGKSIADGFDAGADSAKQSLDEIDDAVRKISDKATDYDVDVVAHTERAQATLERFLASEDDRVLGVDIRILESGRVYDQVGKVFTSIRREAEKVGTTVEKSIGTPISRTIDRSIEKSEELDEKIIESGKKLSEAFTLKNFRSFGQLQFSLFKTTIAAGAFLNLLVPMGPALAGVAAGAVALGGALGLAAGSLISVSAAAASAALSFGTLKIGSMGVTEAFEAQAKANEELARTGEISEGTQERLDAAMKRLAPSARAFVKEIDNLRGAWGKVQKQTQESLFKGSAGMLEKLSSTFLPAIREALEGTARDFNGFAESFTNSLTSAKGLETVNTILRGMRTSLQNIVPAIGNIVSGFAVLFAASQGEAASLTEKFEKMTEKFEKFATSIAESGKFQEFLRRASEAAGILLRSLGGVAQILGGVFAAGAETGVGMLASLEEKINSVVDTLHSAEGQEFLAGFFANIEVTAQALSDLGDVARPILKGLGDILQELAPAFDHIRESALPMSKIIGEDLGAALSEAAPAIGAIVSSVGSLLEVIEPLAHVIVPVAVGFYGARAAIAAYNIVTAVATTVTGAFTAASYGSAGATYAQGRAQVFLTRVLLVTKRIVGLLTIANIKALAVSVSQRVAAIAETAAVTARNVVYAAFRAIMVASNAVGLTSLALSIRQRAAAIAETVAVVARNVAYAAFRAVMVAGTVAMSAMTAAQWALNAAMAANPVGLIVIAIVALVAALVVAYKKSETFRSIVDAVGKALKEGLKKGIDAATKAFVYLRDNFDKFKPLLLLLLGPIGLVILAFKNFGKIKKFVGDAIDFLKKKFDKFKPFLLLILGPIGLIILAFKNFGKIKKAVGDALDFVKKKLEKLQPVFNIIAGVIGNSIAAFNKFKDVKKDVEKAFNDMSKVFDRFKIALLALLGPIGIAIIAFKKFGEIKEFVSKVFEDIKRVFSNFGASIGPIVRAQVDQITEAFRSRLAKISEVFAKLKSDISRRFAEIKTVMATGARNAVDSIVGFFKSIPSKIGELGPRIRAAGKLLMDKLASGLSSDRGFAGSIANGVGSALKAVVNNIVIRPLNRGLNQLNSAIGALPGVDNPHIQIRELAMGAYLTKPTLALVAEAGREVVIPAEKGSKRIRQLLSESGILNKLSEKDFFDLVAPRLAAKNIGGMAGSIPRISQLSETTNVLNISRSVDNSRTNPTNNVKSTVVQANFNLVSTTDPAQQADQVARRLAAILER